MHNITSSLSLSDTNTVLTRRSSKSNRVYIVYGKLGERFRDIKISFVNQIPCHNFYFLTLLPSCSGAINPISRPHLNVYALATGAASPGYTLVPRAGSPGYTFVPRAGSPEYTPVIGLVALIT